MKRSSLRSSEKEQIVRIHRLIGMCLLFLVPFARPGLAAPTTDQVLLPTGEISVSVGAKVDLHLYDIDSSGALRPAAAVLPAPVWMLNGKLPGAVDASEGKLSVNLTLTDATYVAPDKIPPVNPVAISVQLGSQGPGKPQETLMCSIRITGPENYFKIQGPHVPSEVYRQDAATGRSSASGGFAYIPNTAQMAVLEGDELAIQIAPMGVVPGILTAQPRGVEPDYESSAGMTVGINGNHGIKPGKYVWSIGDNESESTIVNFNIKRKSGMMILYSSTDCVPHNPPPGESCKAISLEGTTTIGDYNPTTGLVNGYFQGNVMLVDPTSNRPSGVYAFAIGQFNTHLMTTPIH